MFKKINVVAIDINGTLIDGTYLPWKTIFEEHLNLRRKEGVPNNLKWYEVQTGQISFEEMVSSTYIVMDPTSLRNNALTIYMANLKLRKNCIELLERLRLKYTLVICSDTSGVTKVIAKRFGLEPYFLEAFYSIDVGWMKSDKEFWMTVLSRFPGVTANEFVMIGDNPRRDIYWPSRLGMGTILVKTTERLSAHSLRGSDGHPDYYVDNLTEIFDLL